MIIALASSMFLTLLVIPVVYVWFDSKPGKFIGWLTRQPKKFIEWFQQVIMKSVVLKGKR